MADAEDIDEWDVDEWDGKGRFIRTLFDGTEMPIFNTPEPEARFILFLSLPINCFVPDLLFRFRPRDCWLKRWDHGTCCSISIRHIKGFYQILCVATCFRFAFKW